MSRLVLAGSGSLCSSLSFSGFAEMLPEGLPPNWHQRSGFDVICLLMAETTAIGQVVIFSRLEG